MNAYSEELSKSHVEGSWSGQMVEVETGQHHWPRELERRANIWEST
jgi:hypothetical protein